MIEFHLDIDGAGPEYNSGHCWLPNQIESVVQLGMVRPLMAQARKCLCLPNFLIAIGEQTRQMGLDHWFIFVRLGLMHNNATTCSYSLRWISSIRNGACLPLLVLANTLRSQYHLDVIFAVRSDLLTENIIRESSFIANLSILNFHIFRRRDGFSTKMQFKPSVIIFDIRTSLTCDSLIGFVIHIQPLSSG